MRFTQTQTINNFNTNKLLRTWFKRNNS